MLAVTSRVQSRPLMMHHHETTVNKLRSRVRISDSCSYSVLLATAANHVQEGLAFLQESAQGHLRRNGIHEVRRCHLPALPLAGWLNFLKEFSVNE